VRVAFGTAPAPAENNPPDTPTGSVGEVTETTAQRRSSPFSDPDGDAHAASQWRIYRMDDGTLVLDSGETTTDLTSFLATGLAPETAYEFDVRHKDDSGDAETEWSEWSVRVAFATAPAPDENNPPDRPTGSVGEVTETTAQLLSSPFSDPDGDAHAASQWRIYRVDDGTLVLDSGETTTDLTSFLATGLAPETAYEFEVRHKDDSGDSETEWSEWSVRVAFETAAIVGWRPCPAPPATAWQPCGLFTPGVLGRFWKRPTEALAMVVDDSLPPDEIGVLDRIEFSNLAPGGQATNWNVRYLATLIPP